MKKFFLFLTLLTPLCILASNTAVDGIYYDFDKTNMTATVTYRGNYYSEYSDEYSGSIIIPSFVTYGGLAYSVTSIGSAAFMACARLTSINIPNSVTSIAASTFYGCSSLTSINIPNSVTSIGGSAFYGCSSLTSINIPNSVTSIESSAFYGCQSLTSVTISNSVTNVGEKAFGNCSKLTSVTWNAKNIANYSSSDVAPFSSCYKIASFVFGNGVEHIPAYLCYNIGCLYTITIPNSVTSIGNCAFLQSTITDIYCKASTPPQITGAPNYIGSFDVNKSPFYLEQMSSYLHKVVTCHIPCGTKVAYKTSAWNTAIEDFIEQSAYTIAISSSNQSYGQAKVSSRPDCESAIITAIPNEGCTFVKWSDGNTQATRYLEVTEDITLTAYFAKEGYTIHVYQDCNTTIE